MQTLHAETGKKLAPFGVNLIVHRTNNILQEELELCRRYEVPLIITSLGAVPDLVESVHSYGGSVFHDVVNLRHAKKAIDAGVDGIIAVSAGAGGHGQATHLAWLARLNRYLMQCDLIWRAEYSRDTRGADDGVDLAYMGTRFINTAECMASDAINR